MNLPSAFLACDLEVTTLPWAAIVDHLKSGSLMPVFLSKLLISGTTMSWMLQDLRSASLMLSLTPLTLSKLVKYLPRSLPRTAEIILSTSKPADLAGLTMFVIGARRLSRSWPIPLLSMKYARLGRTDVIVSNGLSRTWSTKLIRGLRTSRSTLSLAFLQSFWYCANVLILLLLTWRTSRRGMIAPS